MRKCKGLMKVFTVIGSKEDERKIKEMIEGASDPEKKKKFVKEDVLTKVPAEPDVAEQGTKKRKGGHMKMITRKRKRPQPNVDSDDEHRKCLKIVTLKSQWELQGIQLSIGVCVNLFILTTTLNKFSDELAHIDLISPGINEVDFDPEEDIRFVERLLHDNSSPRPPEAFQANSNTIIKSLPISVDTLREEIDILHGPDDSIPPGIESDDFNWEDNDNYASLPEFESFHVDYPDLGDSTIDVVEDIPVDVPNILTTHPALQLDFDFIPSNDLGSNLDISSPFGDRNKIYNPGICIEVESTRFLATLSLVIDTLLPFSSENKDKVFNHGVLASKKKSPPSSSHRGHKASKLFHHKSPMLIHGDNTPYLGDCPDFKASRARSFCPSITRASHPQLHLGIQYPNLID
ncbi:hypothetical protein Tco_1533676 [Tanacetum coccineum]